MGREDGGQADEQQGDGESDAEPRMPVANPVLHWLPPFEAKDHKSNGDRQRGFRHDVYAANSN